MLHMNLASLVHGITLESLNTNPYLHRMSYAAVSFMNTALDFFFDQNLALYWKFALAIYLI